MTLGAVVSSRWRQCAVCDWPFNTTWPKVTLRLPHMGNTQSVVCVRKVCANGGLECSHTHTRSHAEAPCSPVTPGSLTAVCGVSLSDHSVLKLCTRDTWLGLESDSHHVFDDTLLDSYLGFDFHNVRSTWTLIWALWLKNTGEWEQCNERSEIVFYLFIH